MCDRKIGRVDGLRCEKEIHRYPADAHSTSKSEVCNLAGCENELWR